MKKIIFFLIISLIPLDTNAHVGHHKNLKSLDFEIYRNGKYAGFHTIDFNWSKSGALTVKNVIEFGVKYLIREGKKLKEFIFNQDLSFTQIIHLHLKLYIKSLKINFNLAGFGWQMEKTGKFYL